MVHIAPTGEMGLFDDCIGGSKQYLGSSSLYVLVGIWEVTQPRSSESSTLAREHLQRRYEYRATESHDRAPKADRGRLRCRDFVVRYIWLNVRCAN